MTSGELLTMTIDRDALAHNMQQIVQRVAPAKVIAVVKADGYNHGAVEAARVFLANGAAMVGVATIHEALELRRGGITSPILAWIWDAEDRARLSTALTSGIELGVASVKHLNAVMEEVAGGGCGGIAAGGVAAGDGVGGDGSGVAAGGARGGAAGEGAGGGTLPRLTLMLDSGMSRSGFSPSTWRDDLPAIVAAARSGAVTITGAMTHLACADEPTHPQNNQQKAQFEAMLADLRAEGVACPVCHMANSPATLTRPDMRYQMVRPGVALYGMNPLDDDFFLPLDDGADHQSATGKASGQWDRRPVDLRPAMMLSARVVTTRVIPAGAAVSYGATWTAAEDTATAVVAMGYADGLPRALSGRMVVAINGRLFRQVGRVCMDQIIVVLGPAGSASAASVQPGDEAVIFGAPGPAVPVPEVAGLEIEGAAKADATEAAGPEVGGAAKTEAAEAAGPEVEGAAKTEASEATGPDAEGAAKAEAADAAGPEAQGAAETGAPKVAGAGARPAAAHGQPDADPSVLTLPAEFRTLPTATSVAKQWGTIHYEVLTSPHTRVRRRYVGRGIAAEGRIAVATAQETRDVAARLGALLQAGDLVVLDGPLGAGKTTFTQGLAVGLGVQGPVTSPTFTIARVHRPVGGGVAQAGSDGEAPRVDSDVELQRPSLVHVDAYRLLDENAGATDPLGALDSLDLDTDLMDAVVVAEWASDLAESFHQDYLEVSIRRATGADSTAAEASGLGTAAEVGSDGAIAGSAAGSTDTSAGLPAAGSTDTSAVDPTSNTSSIAGSVSDHDGIPDWWNDDDDWGADDADEFPLDEPRVITWRWVRREPQD